MLPCGKQKNKYMESKEPLDQELTTTDLSEHCLSALKSQGITTLRHLTDKTWSELRQNTVLGKNETLAVLLDFVQNIKKLDFKKT